MEGGSKKFQQDLAGSEREVLLEIAGSSGAELQAERRQTVTLQESFK